eukprot:6953389-Prymnesium_polylepis.1
MCRDHCEPQPLTPARARRDEAVDAEYEQMFRSDELLCIPPEQASVLPCFEVRAPDGGLVDKGCMSSQSTALLGSGQEAAQAAGDTLTGG